MFKCAVMWALRNVRPVPIKLSMIYLCELFDLSLEITYFKEINLAAK